MTEEEFNKASNIQYRIQQINKGLDQWDHTKLKSSVKVERQKSYYGSEYYDQLAGFTDEAFNFLKQYCVANLHKERQELKEELASI